MSRSILFTLAVTLAFPATSFAHKVWLLPSQTVLSGAEPWVTVDAAVSNDLFYFNHFPLQLDGLTITAPDGTDAQAQNQSVGRYRSVFDLPLEQEGTYRVAVLNEGLFASYQKDGETRRWRGSPKAFAAEIPGDAEDLHVTEYLGRVETFVTNGPPTKTALKPTGKGIELIPVTHPNDLYAGETGTFRVLVEGKPAAGLEVEVVRGGTRYRDTQGETHLTTDENGEFSMTWPEPGMYWLETSSTDDKTTLPQAGSRRLSYAATLEVLPQ
ncbi:DUF4198 domain-containing protein [Alienimonas sp. DA493]|uniref:DUF4198 domain-containing protein n=1 Tax=Alienimonas sp. DA493 TaxID=3373605 RepID=UPI003754689D